MLESETVPGVGNEIPGDAGSLRRWRRWHRDLWSGRSSSLFEGSLVAGMSDRQLLDRFIAQRDFGRRGGVRRPWCDGTARWSLASAPSFWAIDTMLRTRFKLSSWSSRRSALHPRSRPARKLALRRRASHVPHAKVRIASRSQERGGWLHGERRLECRGSLPPRSSFLVREQAEVLHEEIERLPRAFRLPVVFCYLEGLTVHEAARRLRCSHGTVRSRMARAEKLRRGLTRRGVGLPATVLAAAFSSRPASASVSSQLCETMAQAAIQFAAGQAASPLRGIAGPGGPTIAIGFLKLSLFP